MSLTEYRHKRQFDSTPEPQGARPNPVWPPSFVVQKHAASHLHYDFRLELDGVLKSWAVPKGPSLNPADKRLAIMVEDHPLEYRHFEGRIPVGNYGAGTVMVWDEGVYTSLEEGDDPAKARQHLHHGLAAGDLKIVLSGRKLKGAFGLVKMKSQDNSWLLIKKHDEYQSSKDIAQQDKTAATGRSLSQIERSATSEWLAETELDLGDAPRTAMPSSVQPMLATLAARAFDDENWWYEVKWDGYRIIAHVQQGQVQLKSRSHQDYTRAFAPVCQELSNLRTDCVLDGEMVVVDGRGKSDFGALQNYQKTGQGDLCYYVFDVLYAKGRNLCQLPLYRRKQIATRIVQPLSSVRMSDHVEGRGVAFFELAKREGLEGVIAKNANSTYQEGRRSPDWLKIKTHLQQEAVIGGWTEPRGSRKQIGALVLGVYEDDRLRYIGHAGGGLSDKDLSYLYHKLKPLECKVSPFGTEFKTNAPVHWAQPKLLAEVSFAEWTGDGRMRQPIFEGLREDKEAKQVKQEVPQDWFGGSDTKVDIKHRHKVFWPKQGYTKGDLIDYYDQIAELILPYLRGRPESMNRYPDGVLGSHFFQKDLRSHPDWVQTEPIYSESNQADINWLVCNDRDTLLYMINMGCIELNPWHSRIGKLGNPDWCLIDLDAKTCTFENVIKVAQVTHKLLRELGIFGYSKTSGKTGLHICIPLEAQYSFEQSRQFAQLLVSLVHDRLPELTSLDRDPKRREGKIYLDYLQNRVGQTMAAPYCVRPVPGAVVSTPLKWNEVRKGLDPKKFTMKNIGKRLDKVGDLWQPVLGKGIDMKIVLERLGQA